MWPKLIYLILYKPTSHLWLKPIWIFCIISYLFSNIIDLYTCTRNTLSNSQIIQILKATETSITVQRQKLKRLMFTSGHWASCFELIFLTSSLQCPFNIQIWGLVHQWQNWIYKKKHKEWYTLYEPLFAQNPVLYHMWLMKTTSVISIYRTLQQYEACYMTIMPD